eukprot:SAG31_NODE_20270_length_579_cov_0.835417_1_plen_25_part_01
MVARAAALHPERLVGPAPHEPPSAE